MMDKYVIKCGIMRGTGIKGERGDILEFNSKSESVQDLVKRGWIEKVEEPKKEPKKESKKK